MKRCLVPSIIPLIAALSVGLGVLPARADDGHTHRGHARLSVTVSFGAWLNTAQAANHHILPPVISVRKGGVVNFVFAGFHQIFVYQPGTKREEVEAAAAATTSTFINLLDNTLYQGIAPAGGPPPGTPATANPANGGNRVESVFFAEPGDYLVICNVRGHFLDGMVAVVKVR